MKRFLLAGTILAAVGAPTAHATSITLDFGSLSIGGSGPCVADCIIGTSGLRAIGSGTGVSAEGYSAADHATFLTQKPAADGPAETGIGQSDSATSSSDPNHEIAVGHFVVIDNVLAEALGFEPKSITIGSLQAGEKGAIYGYTGPDGSPDLIPGDLTLLHTFTGGNTGTLDVSGLDYDKYVVGALTSVGSTLSNTVVTSEVLSSTVPEPPTWAMALIGFALMAGGAALSRRRQRQSISLA